MTISEVPGKQRTPGLSWYDLVLEDDRPPVEHLRARVPYTARTQYVPVERYTSRAWHELERTHLWRRVWQMACREEHLPEVGSYVVYEIAGDSYLVTRTREGTIKAYVNACLHRGRALKDFDGRCSEFRCSFHGFTWKLDGSLRYMPGAERVPRHRGRPGGLAAPGGQGRHLGRVRVHQPRSGVRSRWRTSSARCPSTSACGTSRTATSRRTWPRSCAATGRSPRRPSTRACTWAPPIPQSAPYVGDGNSAVDVYGNYARQISPSGTPIDDIPVDPTERDILARMLDVREGEELPIPF